MSAPAEPPHALPEHVLRAVDAEVARGYLGNVRRYDTNTAVRAATYAIDAGAVSPLEYIGQGVQGTVVCDARGRAFKVPHAALRDAHAHVEALWLQAAAPVLGDGVAQFIDYNPDTGVIVRECVRGRPADYERDGVEERCAEIAAAMESVGWTAPECDKADSFVYVKGRGLVLVDGGFAAKLDGRLPWLT